MVISGFKALRQAGRRWRGSNPQCLDLSEKFSNLSTVHRQQVASKLAQKSEGIYSCVGFQPITDNRPEEGSDSRSGRGFRPSRVASDKWGHDITVFDCQRSCVPKGTWLLN
ncbi:hypothetical protein PoB_000678800 [Plakobranchus ocellatus]|uniref:Uncharacterized protein n=1 Tax=Plakobranchus ocellatus TaxID=259542 RepID=A0AAV3YCQ2_9GAST|nr:hypothetical protein PoB_000678800 [Plakobranchus ocellatus]